MGMMKLGLFVGFVVALGACASEEEPSPELGDGRGESQGETLGEVVQLLGECTVSLQCTTAPTISCSGTNYQCSVGTNSVTCNGVTTNCLPPSSACSWAGTTYIHGSNYLGQCSSRIDGVCRTGPFTGLECEAPLHCSPKCQNGQWVPRF